MPAVHANRFLPALRRVILVRESGDVTDGQLLTAYIRDRDGDAFALLVRRHGAMVLGVCRRVTGDADAAEDAFQAVFLLLARRAAAVHSRERVGNWLYGVAYRTALKARTLRARRRNREKQVQTMPEPLVHTARPAVEWDELQRLIDEELSRLPERLRLPVVLCDLEGRPQRAVAKQLGMPPATLASRLSEARRLLAGRLTRRGVALSGGALATVLCERASAASVTPVLAEATVRAADALAAGAENSSLAGVVSGQAVQLCEGVLRMMLLSKLKTAAITAVTLIAVALGFGMPSSHADEPKATSTPPSAAPASATHQREDDAAFLRRICLDLTGQPPTSVETGYFLADADSRKRRKVVDWLMASETVRDHLAGRGDRKTTAKAVYEREITAAYKALSHYRKQRFDAIMDSVNERKLLMEQYAEGKGIILTDFDADGRLDLYLHHEARDGDAFKVEIQLAESDADFLKRVLKSARGSAPTPIEEKYFTEDKDEKKREKLLDLILTDPATAKKLGDDWKKRMLASPAAEVEKPNRYRVKLVPPPDRFEKLVSELIEAKKTDEQLLEAITLATVSRLPTTEEKRATLAIIGAAPDRKAAWIALARSLANSPKR